MKKILLFLIVLIFGSQGFSQSLSPEVISSSGDHFMGADVQLSWTIGETMIETYLVSSNQLTQGFHQTNLTITLVEDFQNDFQVKVYPNPTPDLLTIEWEKMTASPKLTIVDLTGKVLLSQSLNAQNLVETIDLSAYPAGNYYLQLKKADNQTIKTFKVLKIK